MESEQRLLHDIREGNRMAMRQLYDRYSGFATAVALRYVVDRDNAHDVLQDSFVKIFTHLGGFSYRGEGSLRAWISRIVANEALDFVRQNERMDFTDDLPEGTSEDNPDVERVPPDVLTKMIGRLPAGYRAVLNMFVFEQKSHKEIAEQLGIKENSSASQYNRAKKMLAKMINDYIKAENT